VRDALILLIHLVATIARLLVPGGARTIVAESTLLKQQLAAGTSRPSPPCASVRSCRNYRLPLAIALSRLVSIANRGVNNNSPQTPGGETGTRVPAVSSSGRG
jgi:hypothetical protein